MSREMRASAEKLLERAARAGMADAARLLHSTPREIELEFRALARRREQEVEMAAQAAWLAGKYAMIGLHAPQKYPPMPCGHEQCRTDEEMKDALVRAAGRWSDEHSTGCAGDPV